MRGVFASNRDQPMRSSYHNFLEGAQLDGEQSNLSLLRRWQESTSKFDSNIIINNLKRQPGMNSKLRLPSRRSRLASNMNIASEASPVSKR